MIYSVPNEKYWKYVLSDLIKQVCGESPNGEKYVNIVSNPNYVFQPDPSFLKVKLYDIDGNSVIVNSWIECAHYVNGGWSSYIETFNGPTFLFKLVIGISFSYIMFKFIFLRND